MLSQWGLADNNIKVVLNIQHAQTVLSLPYFKWPFSAHKSARNMADQEYNSYRIRVAYSTVTAAPIGQRRVANCHSKRLLTTTIMYYPLKTQDFPE